MKLKIMLGVGLLLYIGGFVVSRILAERQQVEQSSEPVFQVDNISIELITTHNSTSINQAFQSFLDRDETVDFPIHEYTLRYKLERPDQEAISASAEVFIPEVSPDERLATIVYGPGTTGLADRCAPSQENPFDPTLGNYRNQMITYAAQKKVVIMPDYLGFDTQQQLQHYFIAEQEAYSILSAAKAFFSAIEDNLLTADVHPKKIFVGGYSQGGHSAFATADYVESLFPEIEILGVMGHGPTTDVLNTLRSNPNLAPYIFTAYQQYYPEFSPTDMLQPNFLSSLSEAERICADEGFGYNSVTAERVYTADFWEALQQKSVASKFPVSGVFLAQNAVGARFTDIPVFVAQGVEDTIVTLEDQTVFVEQMCQRGISVSYFLYDNQQHFFTRQRSFEDTHEWMNTLLEGKSPSGCVTQRVNS